MCNYSQFMVSQEIDGSSRSCMPFSHTRKVSHTNSSLKQFVRKCLFNPKYELWILKKHQSKLCRKFSQPLRFRQSLRRHLTSPMKAGCKSSHEFTTFIRTFFGLPFVHPNDVSCAFGIIKASIPIRYNDPVHAHLKSEIMVFIEYVKDTYIGRLPLYRILKLLREEQQ